ncbi:MAG: undecaprenyldiphospho-muramoylpentapeptide beta-N-acetylglucosaminyltransferase [Erysipelotrichaceae bacterium]
MKIVLATGGTGGHIYPALALADHLKSHNDILFIGSDNRMESRIIPDKGYDFVGLELTSFEGSFFQRLNFMPLMRACYKECIDLFKKEKVDVVIGFGNYITVPVVLAAKKLNIPVLLHEQNSIAGKANLFLKKYSKGIITCYEKTAEQFKDSNVYLYGNPRSSIVDSSRLNNDYLKELGLKENVYTICIVMGSLGSASVNELMYDVLKEMRYLSYQVLYVSGQRHYDKFKERFEESDNVKVVPYCDLLRLYNSIDLLVCRSGATTLAEICAFGKCSILIPSPYVPNNHQYFNAKELVDKEAALMIEEKDFSSTKFIDLVKLIGDDKELQIKMKNNALKLAHHDANSKIEELIEKIVGEK